MSRPEKVIEFQDPSTRADACDRRPSWFDVVSLRWNCSERRTGQRRALLGRNGATSVMLAPPEMIRPGAAPPKSESDDGRSAVSRSIVEIRSGDLGVANRHMFGEIDAVQGTALVVGLLSGNGARPRPGTTEERRDRDVYDTVADHLLVVDHSLAKGRRASSAPIA